MTLGLISDLDPAVVANLDLDARASYDGVESEIAWRVMIHPRVILINTCYIRLYIYGYIWLIMINNG